MAEKTLRHTNGKTALSPLVLTNKPGTSGRPDQLGQHEHPGVTAALATGTIASAMDKGRPRQ